MAFRNNLSFLQQPFPVIKYFIHDRWLAINLAENNSLGILDEKLIRYRIHSSQETGGRKDEIEKYIEINKNLFSLYLKNFLTFLKYFLIYLMRASTMLLKKNF